MAYNVLSIEDISEAIGEEKLLENFKCELNKDVEHFLKNDAIQFYKMGMSKTFLVFTTYQNKNVIVGYFALTDKITRIKRTAISNSIRKRLLRFAKKDELDTYYTISLPLIGQLGKNYYNNYNELITGDILLKLACDKIREVQHIIGGKFVFLECEDKPQLKEFYESNGFVHFGNRNLDKDERERNCGQYLLQMLCDLSKK